MALTRVTITGADDHTNPRDLCRLWERFPFVEFGILVGSSAGERFPTQSWIRELIDARRLLAPIMDLSLHVCGLHLKQIARGLSVSLLTHYPREFREFGRVQLNWHGEKQDDIVGERVLTAFQSLWVSGCDKSLIFQLDAVNDDLIFPAATEFNCEGLFDRSHGAGLAPDAWPVVREDFDCGWAGGLGPDNLSGEILRIIEAADPERPFWIDMETKVRSDDGLRLDLDKVRRCLEIAEPFIEQ